MRRFCVSLLVFVLAIGMAASAYAAPTKPGEDWSEKADRDTPGDAEWVSEPPKGVTQEEWDSWKVFISRERPIITRELVNTGGFMQDTGLSVIRCFSESIQAQVRTLLPADYNIDTLKLYEFVPIGDEGYIEKFGDTDVLYSFQTDYPIGTNVVSLVGVIQNTELIAYPKQQSVNWYVLRSEVISSTSGEISIRISFTKELLLQMLNYETVPVALGIVSDPLH